ncbi:MAG: serine/threonine-protein kinase [candidate division Zixibacteria bacterium]|nr:serine/threonine-protein kinase [candidate division Zixibacteria bacterium]MCI0596698.1 serine/threonine-protein kinase [candidate division Zixibacteria bacterium]
MFKKFQGFILYILITLFVLALYWDRQPAVEKMDLKLADQMFRLRGNEPVGPDVAIVQIDMRASDLLGRYPWSRERWAGVLNALSLYRPKVVALDLSSGLVDRADTSILGNYLLADVLQREKNIVVPFSFIPAEQTPSTLSAPNYFAGEAFPGAERELKSLPLTAAGGVNYPDPGFAEKGAGLGHNTQLPDGDGTLRWHPLAVNFEGLYYPSLALTTARLYLGLSKTQCSILPGDGVKLGSAVIPTDREGRFFINYAGSAGSFKAYNLSDVLRGQIDPNALKGKAVILAKAPLGLAGSFKTPVEPALSTAELTANLVESILQRRFIKTLTISKFLDVSFLILIGVLAAFLLPQVTLAYRMIILGIFLVALTNLAFVLFNSFGILTKPFYAILELVFFLAASPVLKARRTEVEVLEEYGVGYTGTQKETVKAASDGPDSERMRESEASTGLLPSAEETAETPDIEPHVQTREMTEPEIIADEATLYEQTSLKPKESKSSHQPLDRLKTLGRYEIQEVLGKGAMGTVYKGLDPAIDRLVALKTIRLDAMAEESEIQELKERLVREAKAAGKLSHPNIVTIYDVGYEGDLQYIAMEYLEGYTLEEIIKRQVVLNFKIVAKLIVQVCDALDYAHDRGIVHRDVKPANIMVMNNFQVKVMDFGIARLETSTSMTQTGIAMGTPNYISPEQLQGKPVDRRSDIFALGVVLYEFLSHEKPFRGENLSQLIYNIINHNPAPPVEKDESIPMILNRVTLRAIAKDPLERYQRAGELAAELKEFLVSFIPSAPKPRQPAGQETQV